MHMDAHRVHVEYELDGRMVRVTIDHADDHLLVSIDGRVVDWPNGPEEVFKVFPPND